MLGDVGQVVREVAGVLRLDGLGDGAVEVDPLRRRERRLDRLPGEGMDEAVLLRGGDPLDQAVGDGLVDQR